MRKAAPSIVVPTCPSVDGAEQFACDLSALRRSSGESFALTAELSSCSSSGQSTPHYEGPQARPERKNDALQGVLEYPEALWPPPPRPLRDTHSRSAEDGVFLPRLSTTPRAIPAPSQHQHGARRVLSYGLPLRVTVPLASTMEIPPVIIPPAPPAPVPPSVVPHHLVDPQMLTQANDTPAALRRSPSMLSRMKAQRARKPRTVNSRSSPQLPPAELTDSPPRLFSRRRSASTTTFAATNQRFASFDDYLEGTAPVRQRILAYVQATHGTSDGSPPRMGTPMVRHRLVSHLASLDTSVTPTPSTLPSP
eukprot:NODE_419_length_1511_cov_633.722298_g309_i0.p1 GENE.NODE_419_length_1511_cov_633.722298_g309_i0~~NODE_419_length_1511_cov_633.722298_g309_i0.p1  ORF type:complete len:308 (+),score=21.38 NODE_419_length_1511_cov_633.722298_g309_i0:57-980(+)